jgi:hypothetical protein
MWTYFSHQILLSLLFGEVINWQNVTASVTGMWMGREQWCNDTDRGKLK